MMQYASWMKQPKKQEINYSGITGNITFDENGDPIKDVAILKLEDGAVTLETKLAAE